MEFFATCPKGFESLLAGELSALGVEPRALKGQVAFEGSMADAQRVCLWSRIASRVLLVLTRSDAGDADALYEGVSGIEWESLLKPQATISIDAHGTNDQLRNTRFLAQRAKDAVADRMLARTGARPMVDTANPDCRISVRLRANRATVSADLSGEPLFHRGYERLNQKALPFAPLRADYAAAILANGRWHRACRRDSPTLVCAFPGAGMLLAEAASEALDRAPGLLRARWGFEGWSLFEAETWESLVTEADERAEAASGRDVTLLAADTRRGSEQASRATMRAAGITFEADFVSGPARLGDVATDQSSLVAVDLSWVDPVHLPAEARALSRVRGLVGSLPEHVCVSALAADDALDASLPAERISRIETIVGSEAASLSAYELGPLNERSGSTVTVGDRREISVLVGASDQFAARLSKVARLRAKWARREDVTCYRVYDADLPDYAVAIDLYQGSSETPGRWLVVSEYAAPKEIDPETARRRLLDVLAIAPDVLEVAPDDVILRVRQRAKGGSQYADGGKEGDAERRGGARRRDDHHGHRRVELPFGSHLVDEGGLTFEVSLSDRLDTGLFLDHRDVRARIREMAKATEGSKRFLNLFAYTGTATCYAADGGAKHTTTVDLSRPYLDVARRNMERNGFVGREHEFVQADVVSWVSEQRRTKNRWDLIFCDPPTFSNSSRMRTSSFDVQRDHAELLIGISRLLTRNGVCVFSCNLRGFEPDVEALAKVGVSVEDITKETIPEDFARNGRIHHCYLVRRI